jgi:uncharacterized membrane protein
MNGSAGAALRVRTALRWLLSAAYAAAGFLHLYSPTPFVKIVPGWVPMPGPVVALTGMAELLGAVALAQPWSKGLRVAGGFGLALYALCVWPANFHHMALDLARPDEGLGLAYHLPRLAFQPVLIWLALWTGEATDWPFARPQAND